MKNVGLVRVLTTGDAELLTLHGRLIEQKYPSLSVTSRCIPDHPEGVHDEITRNSAAPLVARLAEDFERQGFDAVIVSCADDPGVREARSRLRIPVVGAGEATAGVALALGERVGVLGITDYVPQRMCTLLGSAMVYSTKPVGVRTTLDLMTARGRQAVGRSLTEFQLKRVDVIALACTGMSTIGAAGRISGQAGLRVVDPVDAAGLIATYVTM